MTVRHLTQFKYTNFRWLNDAFFLIGIDSRIGNPVLNAQSFYTHSHNRETFVSEKGLDNLNMAE